MSQKRSHSALESVSNVVVGFTLSFYMNMVCFPYFGWHISTEQNLTLGVIYTLVSLARSYVLRRVFNRHTGKVGSVPNR